MKNEQKILKVHLWFYKHQGGAQKENWRNPQKKKLFFFSHRLSSIGIIAVFFKILICFQCF